MLLLPSDGVAANNAINERRKRIHHHEKQNNIKRKELLSKTRRAGSNFDYARRHEHYIEDHIILRKELPRRLGDDDHVLRSANGTSAEREILMEFYDATNGAQWYDSPGNNWGSNNIDHCNWGHIECADLGRVVTLDIVDNGQSGYLPSSLGGLASLDRLSLSTGSIGGGVPHELFELRNITFLTIYGHELNGTLPATLNDYGALDKLEILQLTANKLSGEIPELHLPSIWALFLRDNEFSGKIPSLDNVPQLQWLYFDNNKLKGNIPSLNNVPQLQKLVLYTNKLVGNIPSLNNVPQL